jgi:hypothetical protein
VKRRLSTAGAYAEGSAVLRAALLADGGPDDEALTNPNTMLLPARQHSSTKRCGCLCRRVQCCSANRMK